MYMNRITSYSTTSEKNRPPPYQYLYTILQLPSDDLQWVDLCCPRIAMVVVVGCGGETMNSRREQVSVCVRKSFEALQHGFEDVYIEGFGQHHVGPVSFEVVNVCG